MANPEGSNIEAAVASPPSPFFSWEALGFAPVPATVVIMPVLAVTFRIR